MTWHHDQEGCPFAEIRGANLEVHIVSHSRVAPCPLQPAIAASPSSPLHCKSMAPHNATAPSSLKAWRTSIYIHQSDTSFFGQALREFYHNIMKYTLSTCHCVLSLSCILLHEIWICCSVSLRNEYTTQDINDSFQASPTYLRWSLYTMRMVATYGVRSGYSI